MGGWGRGIKGEIVIRPQFPQGNHQSGCTAVEMPARPNSTLRMNSSLLVALRVPACSTPVQGNWRRPGGALGKASVLTSLAVTTTSRSASNTSATGRATHTLCMP